MCLFLDGERFSSFFTTRHGACLYTHTTAFWTAVLIVGSLVGLFFVGSLDSLWFWLLVVFITIIPCPHHHLCLRFTHYPLRLLLPRTLCGDSPFPYPASQTDRQAWWWWLLGVWWCCVGVHSTLPFRSPPVP